MWVYESIITSIDSVSEWVVDWFSELILTEPNSSFLLRQIYKQVIQPDLQTHLIMINHNLSLSQAIYAFTTTYFQLSAVTNVVQGSNSYLTAQKYIYLLHNKTNAGIYSTLQ